MELRIFTEPQQGATYDDLLAVALEAEKLGFGAFFRSDHYLKMGDVTGDPGPSDAWTALAGLARDTSTIRLGTLVTSATFRHPAVLALQVAGVDQMSNGRVEFGLGAGWFDAEHEAFGIPFPSVKERFDRLEEQLAIITGLWNTKSGEGFSHDGEHYQLADNPGLTKPAQSELPIIIGGSGKKRTPALAVKYAAEFNAAFDSVEQSKALFERVTAAATEAGREKPLTLSAAQVLCVGSDEAELERRAAAIGRDKDELRENGVAGTVDEAIAKIKQFAEIGAERLYLQVLDLHDLDHLRLVAAEVMPQV
ncbi:LLM class F420-dependent oxidoreductase [Nocardioides sp. Kera G14]|uniref:LLM class F420-dependent oxidoreductase n=1 Tax=Nocardioides sp. Kera G14 TaxID=2884264 RepID=UPI001D11049B|nr:LLM class F420-dependent oxidoreductase [Nocardioides sp. Kera G14]UDY25066.1 LLM class F420-dependent oxidoreductase [Nocardioides sp. Kera G14]